MLVLTSPVDASLARQGTNFEDDFEMLMVVEPETLEDAYRSQMTTQAQCLVAQTANLLPSRLLHKNLEKRLPELVRISLEMATAQKAQHVLVELGPTGLPLDPSSKASLMEHRDQYVRAAREFEHYPFDAYLLNDFTDVDALKCALMGLRKASDRPVFASVNANAEGVLGNGRHTLQEAVAVMQEFGASVAGVQTPCAPAAAAHLARGMASACSLPLMVQLQVGQRNAKQLNPTDENPYYRPETLFDAIPHLRSAGVQFLRATGNATPAYAAALAAVLVGLDVIDVRGILED